MAVIINVLARGAILFGLNAAELEVTKTSLEA